MQVNRPEFGILTLALILLAALLGGVAGYLIAQYMNKTRLREKQERATGLIAEAETKAKDIVLQVDRFAADGGDLEPDQEKIWVEKGMTIKRVSNNHEDVQRFRDDIVAAFEELFGAVR